MMVLFPESELSRLRAEENQNKLVSYQNAKAFNKWICPIRSTIETTFGKLYAKYPIESQCQQCESA